MTAAPQIFDSELMIRRQGMAQLPLFLNEEFERALLDRLNDVTREFEHVALLGDTTLVGALREHPKIKHVTCLGPGAFTDEIIKLPPQSTDLIISAWHMGWLNDVPGYLAQIKNILKPDGWFLAVLYGGESLIELRTALWEADEEISGGVSVRVAPMIDLRDAAGLLQRANFALPVADHDVITVQYPDMFSLMREIRMAGLSNILTGRRKGLTTKKLFLRAAQIYQEKFGLADGQIPATAEIISLSAWAPADTQQKAMIPGTATQRLADALNATEHKV